MTDTAARHALATLSPNRPIATAMNRLQQAVADLFDQAKLAPAQT